MKIRDMKFPVYTTNQFSTNYYVTSRKQMVCNIEICFRKYSKSMKTLAAWQVKLNSPFLQYSK